MCILIMTKKKKKYQLIYKAMKMIETQKENIGLQARSVSATHLLHQQKKMRLYT